MTSATVFAMKGITKVFPGIKALDDVSFDCRAGEVHALVGENGAGKSTLIKILSGVYQPDSGEIELNGQTVRFTHPLASLTHGISVIYQEFSLLPDRTVAENLFLGREITKHGFLHKAAMRQETARVLAMFGERHHFDADTLVDQLAVAQQQMVEIAKALSLNARVIVMDEPTAALNETECDLLFSLIDDLRMQGRSIVYITHRMREIQRLANRITVLKDGCVATQFDHVPPDSVIVEAMVGRDIVHFYPNPATVDEIGETMITVIGGGNAQLHNINLVLRAGEITGFAGVQGAGRTALALALFGAEPFTEGHLEVAAQKVVLRSVRQAAKVGIAMFPGNRKTDGLALMQSVRDNGMLSARAFSPIHQNPDKTRFSTIAEMDAIFASLDLRAANYDVEISSLSGGNQQKAIVARWLALHPQILIFVEPTRGIDVNTKAAIYEQMRNLARAGAAVMVISSDLPEVLGVADRILVMSNGTIVAKFPHGTSESAVMHAATTAQVVIEEHAN